MARSYPPLIELPVELIQEIAGHLDRPSAACFARTCRSALWCLDTDQLKIRGDDRQVFLSILVSEIPGYVHCVRCRKIHRQRHPRNPKSWFLNWNPQCSGAADPIWNGMVEGTFQWYQSHVFGGSGENISIAPGYALHYALVKHVMLRHRYGLEVDEDLDRFEYSWQDAVHHEYDITARIVDDSFLVQRVVQFPAHRPTGLSLALSRLFGSFNLCPHLIYWRNGRGSAPRGRPVSFKPDQGLQQCPCCHTEFLVRELSDENVEVTAWYDFGTGVPEDSGEPDARFRFHCATWPGVVRFLPGDIFEAWESVESSETSKSIEIRQLTYKRPEAKTTGQGVV